MVASTFQLQCLCNNYPWGRVGKDSLAATLCAKTPSTSFKIENQPYAEMWMGDYPVLPAKALQSGEELNAIIEANKKQLLGQRCIDKFGGVLPFLPKILSIAKALPLQIHPNKQLSEKLHMENPDQFTDPNHKPEIAVALGPFEVFAGFKEIRDVKNTILALPNLMKVLGIQTDEEWNNETLRSICLTLLQANEEVVHECQQLLAKADRAKLGDQAYILDLLPRLQSQYSKDDNGILIALLAMNYLKLNVGDAIYVPADAPHAYLSGNIVECMARSNNVLNTGFCPKADRDDIELFSKALTFSPHSDGEVRLPANKTDKGQKGMSQVYAPPMSEFNMLRTRLADGQHEVIAGLGGPGVLFVTGGTGELEANGELFGLEEGFIFFVGYGTDLQLKGKSSTELDVWMAYAE